VTETRQPRLPAPRRIGLTDVAREAGVHVSTVSRILNGAEITVAPETRKRVLDTARRLRYRPQVAGRMLRSASSGALGLLVPSLRNPVWGTVAHGAIARGAEHGLVILIAEDSGDDARQVAYERLVSEGRIDGLVICSAPVGRKMLARMEEDAIPVVFANRGVPRSNRNVVMDEDGAARLAVEHLAERGHRRIAQIDGPARIDTARRRTRGFRAACRELGIDGLVHNVPFTEEGGYETVRDVLSAGDPPTACIVSNLNQMLGAMAAVTDVGSSFPDKMALVTYDDDPISDFLAPPLTGIRMPMHEMGKAAVDAILGRIEGRPAQDVTVATPPLLVLRGSTGPAPG
jgi:LacI family transcriptional regulator